MFFYFIFFTILTSPVLSWDLSSLNITNFSIQHVSLYCNRAFLCIEHGPTSKKFPVKFSPATLIEAQWPETLPGLIPKVFGEEITWIRPHLACDNIISARATDIDKRGNLWILDDGGRYKGTHCAPKLSIHSLIILNERIHVHEFPELKKAKFSSITLDPDPLLDEFDTRAYITFQNRDFMMIYSFKAKTYAKLTFDSNEILYPRKPKITELVVTRSDTMYLLDGEAGRLFSVNTEPFRYTPIQAMENKLRRIVTLRTPLNTVGNLLGKAHGLALHPRDKIFYILPRDGAVVSCDPVLPLAAEFHDIVFLSNHSLSQVLFGWRGHTFVVSNGLRRKKCQKCHCTRIK